MSALPSARLDRMRFSDVVHVFNLILKSSDQGMFTDLYLEPRYAAGLGMQLFGLLSGWLRLPGGHWRRARCTVMRIDGLLAGFLILLRQDHYDEIYMVAVEAPLQGFGLGALLLEDALQHRRPGFPLLADCLPAATRMKGMLAHFGFETEAPLCELAAQRFWLR